MRFEFTIKDLEVETFKHVSSEFIENKFVEYAGKHIGVYDYTIACEDDIGQYHTVIFRILKPRYQIVAIDKTAVVRKYSDFIYTNLHDAEFKHEQLVKEQAARGIDPMYELDYMVEPIYYLDHKI